MPAPTTIGRTAAALALLAPLALPAQRTRAAVPAPDARVIPRHIPITNAIRRALAAGTRDSTGRPTARSWQLRVDYAIDARLDTATSSITGRERVTIHNTSPDTLRQVVLRLDPNVFRPETPKAAPWVPAEATAGMVLTRVAVDGRVALLERATGPAAGQGANALAAAAAAGAGDSALAVTGLTSTVARIRLATPALPGARIALEIDWQHTLPGGETGRGHRMTQRWGDTLYQPTQWYPRVAAYDDLRGWDTELYLGPSEFHNRFGRWDVRLDVPAGWLVSGTGTLRNADAVLTATARARLARVLESDSLRTIVGADEHGPGRATTPSATGRHVWHFTADSVNDFAWATSRAFVWRATRATIPADTAADGRFVPAHAVPIHLLHLPGRARLFDDAGAIARHALEFYSRLWFAYPFPQLTLQDGPSAGMEYPMVINSNRGAADHETAHQWWPMVVGTNETWYGWMDEGFNQYMNLLSAADVARRPARLDGLGQSYGRIAGDEAEPAMMWNANYAGPQYYGFTTYTKVPLMLSSLGGIVGDSAVIAAHRAFARAWRFRHPSPWDWMFFMERALGQDLGWFFHGWLFTNSSTDAAIAAVRTTGRRTTVTIREDGQLPSPVVLDVTLAPGTARVPRQPHVVMTDSVTARVTLPASVWFDGRRTRDVVLDLGRRTVERIVLDPGRRFPDRDPSENVWPRAAGREAAGR